MLIPKEELTGNKGLPAQAGQSLVEILVALAVFSLTISATTLLFFSGQNFSSNAMRAREALQKSHDGFEALKILRDTSWTTMTNGTHGLQFTNNQWTMTSSPDWSNGYKRSVLVATNADGSKRLDLTVAWNNGAEGTKSLGFSDILTPPDQGVVGDWTQPCVIGTGSGSTGSKGTDVVYANGKAYVASSASAVGKEDLFIFNVSNPTTPIQISSTNFEQGWKSVSVAGTYLYAVEETSADFFVVNVSNPAAPVQTAKLTLAGGSGRYVMARGSYVYVTTANNAAGKEFFIIDVSTPSSPTVVASLEIGSDINEVSVLQNIAYLATSDDAKELQLINVSNPLSPTIIGSYNVPGTADGRSIHAKSVQRIYLGRTYSSDKELLILDASAPAAITLRGSQDVSGDVFSILGAVPQAFLGTNDTNQEFQDFNIRDVNNITQSGGKNLSNIGSGADYSNNLAYISVQNVDILNIISAPINGVCGG